MAINYPTYRARLGLDPADSSRDSDIDAYYALAVNWLESYLDRFLIAGTQTETLVHKFGDTISLKGYPVISITSAIADNQELDKRPYHLDHINGLIQFDGTVGIHETTIVYQMGDPLVGVLGYALLPVFDLVAAGMNTTVDAVGGGAIKAITSDGAKVEFDVGSGGSVGSITVDETGLPESIVGILELYKRYQC